MSRFASVLAICCLAAIAGCAQNRTTEGSAPINAEDCCAAEKACADAKAACSDAKASCSSEKTACNGEKVEKKGCCKSTQ